MKGVKSIKDGSAIKLGLVLTTDELSAVGCAVANTIGELCGVLNTNHEQYEKSVVKLSLLYRINDKIKALEKDEMVL
jgi:hypothetical protein